MGFRVRAPGRLSSRPLEPTHPDPTALEIREIGGELGIAVVAAVFANQGDYATSTSFVVGFTGP